MSRNVKRTDGSVWRNSTFKLKKKKNLASQLNCINTNRLKLYNFER